LEEQERGLKRILRIFFGANYSVKVKTCHCHSVYYKEIYSWVVASGYCFACRANVEGLEVACVYVCVHVCVCVCVCVCVQAMYASIIIDYSQYLIQWFLDCRLNGSWNHLE
jgi:hypothetical protein